MTASSFEGIPASAFDAYRPEKWSSNVYTRERLEAKQRLVALGRALEPVLGRRGLELELSASDEYPSLWNQKRVEAQWVFFWRTEAARHVLEAEVDLERTLASTLADPTPVRRHAFIALRLEQSSLELALRIHRDAWVDRRNLANRALDPGGLRALAGALAALPEPVTVGPAGEGAAPASGASEELVSRLAADQASEEFFRVGLVLSREQVAGLGPSLAEYLAPMLDGIAGIYELAAWSETNDHVRSDAEFERSRAARGARRDELEAEAVRRRADHEARQKAREQARKELEEQFRREAVARATAPRRPPAEPRRAAEPGQAEPAPERAQPRPAEAPRPAPRPERAGREPAPKAPRPQPIREPAEPIPVQVGHLVKVGRGPLAGQIGTVQDIDSRGNARVMMGLLASRLHLDDLVGLGPAETQKSRK